MKVVIKTIGMDDNKEYPEFDNMGRGSKDSIMMAILGILVFGMLGLGYVFVSSGGFQSGSATIVTEGTPTSTGGIVSCPDTKVTTVAVDVVNYLNTSGVEGFDTTGRFYSLDSGQIIKITDTTSPTASSLNCGEKYVFKLESTDGANGDNSRINNIISGEGSVTPDGDLEFTARGGAMTFEVGVSQQATLQGRMFDVVNNAYMYDTGDTSATDFETDGVAFTSTTDNATNTSIGTGGEVHVKLELKAVQADTDWNDRGTYILVDASPTVWDTSNAVMKVDGQTLSNYKGSLDSNEARKWADYELVYFVDRPVTQTSQLVADFDMYALSSVDAGAGDTIQLDVGARGSYQKVGSANQLGVAGVKDDSSGTVVRTIYDSTLQVS